MGLVFEGLFRTYVKDFHKIIDSKNVAAGEARRNIFKNPRRV